MADPQPVKAATTPARNNLILRVISSAALAPLAIAAAYIGGVVFAVFWVAASAIVLWEWARLVTGAKLRVFALVDWLAGGVAYSAVLLFAPLILRRDPAFGLTAILFLFAIVWATDIVAYFAGQSLGPPMARPAK